MRQHVAYSVLAALLVAAAPGPPCAAQRLPPGIQLPIQEGGWFSCDGPCGGILTNAIGLAHRSIFVEGYRIRPRSLRSALAEAEATGIHVRTIIERRRAVYPGATPPGGPQSAWLDPDYKVDHPEVIVIDNRQVIEVFLHGSSYYRSMVIKRNHPVFLPGGSGRGSSISHLFFVRDRALALAYTSAPDPMGE